MKPQLKKMEVMMTPLQQAVGFAVSERAYDLLDITEQVILDLIISGWQNVDIANLLSIRPRDMKRRLEIIRMKLAGSELHYHLELKAYYKQEHSRVLDEGELATSSGFGMSYLFGQPLSRNDGEI